jgi:serine/threonine protein phosphatase PrpC
MGGHQCGEVASRLAVDTISNHASASVEKLVASADLTLGKLRNYAQDQVVLWAKDANTEIFQKGTELAVDGEKRMGTTMVLMLLVADYVILSHVGDSRIYRMRNKKLELMTEDHITRISGPSKKHSGKIKVKKYVTRALGTKPTVNPDVRVEVAEPGDLFVLCSDGLTDLVREREMQKILIQAESQIQLALRSLIHLANKRGGTDNITVVIGEIWEDEDEDEDTEDLSDALPSGSYF